MRVRVLGCLLTMAVVGGCVESETPSEPSSLSVPVFAKTVDGGPKNFGTHLKGAAERPVPVDTRAQGQAIFQLSKDGTELHYKLIVANIENVTMAHIHCCAGPEGAAGVAVWLYPAAPPPQLIEGRTQGVLAEGVITAAQVVSSDFPGDFEALLAEIRAGNTYVNVHTSQYPGGEVRGQLD